MRPKKTKMHTWYGDTPSRKCPDCGELVDWDERKRLGLVPRGGPTHPDGTPLYDPQARYGDTPEGRAEQAKYNEHCAKYHQEGLVDVVQQDGWRLEIRRYGTSAASEREALRVGRPYYGLLSTRSPSGGIVTESIERCRTPDEVVARAFQASDMGP